jgi:hypothetical protein
MADKHQSATAMGRDALRPQLAASRLFADGRFTTLTGRCDVQEPDIQPRSSRGVRY